MPKCSCGISACFGYLGTVATCCGSHKTEGMVNVVDALCESCDKRASFNDPGKTGGRFCAMHKADGMVNVKCKRCSFVYEGGLPCYIQPIYNVDGELKGKFCVEHKEDGMVNVTGKRCESDGCGRIAQFNKEGEIVGRFCSQHREPNMIDIKHRRCEFDGCMNQPSYKFEKDTSCRFCSTHKLDGMTNGKHATCIYDGCKISAGYNTLGLKTPLYCGVHKLDGMIDVKHPLCAESGCDKRPIFNVKGSKNGLYCMTHKKIGMIDILSPKCKSEWCDNSIHDKRKYDSYCMRCYIHLFPDKPITRNFKTKEKAVVDFVLSLYDSLSWVSDKRIQEGCSRRRPDLLLDLGSHVLVVEIDENQHGSYDCSCDNKRLMELSQDIRHRPLVFIRFNPDSYINSQNEHIRSCWSPNKKNGILYVSSLKKCEWEHRLSLLKSQIDYWLINIPQKMVEVIQLFYDGMLPT